jgi:hypothetical protein
MRIFAASAPGLRLRIAELAGNFVQYHERSQQNLRGELSFIYRWWLLLQTDTMCVKRTR